MGKFHLKQLYYTMYFVVIYVLVLLLGWGLVSSTINDTKKSDENGEEFQTIQTEEDDADKKEDAEGGDKDDNF